MAELKQVWLCSSGLTKLLVSIACKVTSSFPFCQIVLREPPKVECEVSKNKIDAPFSFIFSTFVRKFKQSMVADTTADKDNQRLTLHERGICVVIPTYNNGTTIGSVVCNALKECDDLIVVNDGSTDNTATILKTFGSITVIDYPHNRGKGHALKCGFAEARRQGFSYAITLDGDGQHYPSDIAAFLKANQDHPGALILGSRRLDGVDRSRGSNFANSFSNFWFFLQTGIKAPDTQTGFRLYPLKHLHGLSILTSRYEAELELIVLAAWHGVELESIPINVYYPPREERVSHFRPKADFLRITVLNCVLSALAVAYGLPLRLGRWFVKWGRTVYALLFFLFFMFIVITPWAWFYTKLGRMTERKHMTLHRVIFRASRFIMLHHGIPGVRFTHKVDESVDFNRPSVIICNHQSHLDLVCQLIFTPRIVFLTNDWVYNNPTYGFLIRHAEYLPVRGGIDELLPHLRSLKERGYSIAVFPEGTRSTDGHIGRFHQGAFYIAEELQMPILPMLLYGANRVLKKKTYHLNRGHIHIMVDKAIEPSELTAIGDLRHQASTMRRRYLNLYERLKNRLEQDT